MGTTIQTICSKLEKAIPWIQSVNHQTGLPVLVFLDECQNFGIDEGGGVEDETRNWAPAIKRLQQETNIILIALSGYPHRQDGLCLPGFVMLDVKEEDREKWVRTKVIEVIDEKRRLVEKKLTKYIRQSFTMAPRGGADFIVGMERGFASNALCGLDYYTISHKITYMEDGEVILDNQSLAEVDETTARRALATSVWDDMVVDAGVRKFVDRLGEKRRANKSLKGLIFAMADTAARGEDSHPNKIRMALERNAPHLKVRILTQHFVGSVADALLAFTNDGFDVLILKTVGRVGFDCPRAKVLLDLSTVRTECMVAQTWLRVSTPFEGMLGDVITPGDITAANLFEKIVKHNGGDRLSRTKDGEVIDEDEVLEEKIERSITIGEEEETGVVSHKLQEVPPDQCRLVEYYLIEHPGYIPHMQKMNMPERVEFVHLQMRDHGWTPSPDYAQPKAPPPPQSPKQRRYSEAYQYRIPVRKAWDKATNRAFGVEKYRDLEDGELKKRWQKLHAQLGYDAKRLAGEPSGRELDEIQNLEALEIILCFFEEQFRDDEGLFR
jgi:hypothetical protein